MNRQCGQKIHLYSCKPLRHRNHLSLQHSLTWSHEVLSVKQRVFLVLYLRGEGLEWSLGSSWKPWGTKVNRRNPEQGVSGPGFCPSSAITYIHQIPLITFYYHQGDRERASVPSCRAHSLMGSKSLSRCGNLMKVEMRSYSLLLPSRHCWTLTSLATAAIFLFIYSFY